MASFDYHAPTDRYHIRFRWDKPYKRSLKLPDEKAARRRCQVIEEFIQDLRLGKRAIRPNDPADFIFTGGAVTVKPVAAPDGPTVARLTLGSLWQFYDERSAVRMKELTTRQTEGYHKAHLLRVPGRISGSTVWTWPPSRNMPASGQKRNGGANRSVRPPDSRK